MGRAIDMENDIVVMKMQIEKLQNQLRGMVSRIDEIDDIIDGVQKLKLSGQNRMATCKHKKAVINK